MNKKYVFWFITGSQHLYGEETLKEVAQHSKEMVKFLNEQDNIGYEIIWKPTVKTPSEITETIIEETESKEESIQEDVVEYVKNVNDEVEEISGKIEGESHLDEIEVFEISQNKESSKESLEEVIIKPELIEDKEEYSEDKTTENKEADSIDIKEISKMSVKELRKKIKSLNINITSNKLKSLKKKDLVDILLKYNEEGDS